jgi:hypothetical protein
MPHHSNTKATGVCVTETLFSPYVVCDAAKIQESLVATKVTVVGETCSFIFPTYQDFQDALDGDILTLTADLSGMMKFVFARN